MLPGNTLCRTGVEDRIAGCQLKRFSLAPLTNPQPMGIVDQMWHSMGLHVHNKLDHWSDQQPCMVLALSH